MMKIAVPIKEVNLIDDHFGHCNYYDIYHISKEKQIIEVEKVKSPQGCGCKSNIAAILASEGVMIMLAGGIGNGAVQVLNEAGIQVIAGCSGNAEQAVNDYINGKLECKGSVCKQHNHNGEKQGGGCSGH